jgi:hypothetical protein
VGKSAEITGKTLKMWEKHREILGNHRENMEDTRKSGNREQKKLRRSFCP